MLDHVSITVSDTPAAERFYDAIMKALEIVKIGRRDDWLGYGERARPAHPDRVYLTICKGRKPEKAFGRHWCFKAKLRDQDRLVSARSIDNNNSLREISLPAAREMPIDIPVGLAGIKTGWIYVGVFSLHADVNDIPLNCILEVLGQVMLADHRLDLPVDKGHCCPLYFIDNIVLEPVW
jgi:hypothetical protein